MLPPPPPPVEEVVVTAGRESWPSAVEEFRDLCFDPVRGGASGLDPAGRRGWLPLDDDSRAGLHLARPGAPAWERPGDGERPALTLSFSIERIDGGLDEYRCVLVRLGDDGVDPVGPVSAMFGGPATQRHVGRPDGVPTLDGWAQWRWSAMPGRGVPRWRSINADLRGQPPGWLVVVAPSFYGSHDFIAADLAMARAEGAGIAILTLVRRTKAPC